MSNSAGSPALFGDLGLESMEPSKTTLHALRPDRDQRIYEEKKKKLNINIDIKNSYKKYKNLITLIKVIFFTIYFLILLIYIILQFITII